MIVLIIRTVPNCKIEITLALNAKLKVIIRAEVNNTLLVLFCDIKPYHNIRYL